MGSKRRRMSYSEKLTFTMAWPLNAVEGMRKNTYVTA
jgi:hypothetical protein